MLKEVCPTQPGEVPAQQSKTHTAFRGRVFQRGQCYLPRGQTFKGLDVRPLFCPLCVRVLSLVWPNGAAYVAVAM